MPTTDESTGCAISWSSSNTSRISATGTYARDYADVDVVLTATVSYGDYDEAVSYTITSKGFKSLSNGIKAGYLYTGIASTSTYVLEGLDIIYVAFGAASATGTISNISTIGSTITNYVISKAHAKGVYVILSINGATNLSTIAADASLRATFAASIVSAINTYHLDGIDIDWEFPATSEKANFTLLMKDIYTEVKNNNSHHLVTTATGIDTYTRYDFANSKVYLDYINIMSYDMQTTSYSSFQNALYYKSGKTYVAISNTYTYYVTNSGISTSKLILGIPFYGRKFIETDGLGESCGSVSAISYSLIKSTYLDNLSSTITRTFDSDCQVPYIYDSTNRVFISYDDAESIAIKCEYAHTNGFAGMMYWQDGQDDNDVLATALISGVNTSYGS